MSQDLPHHDLMTPDSAPYFSGRLVWVTGTWFLRFLLLIEIKGCGFILLLQNICFHKYHKKKDSIFVRKEKLHDSLI